MEAPIPAIILSPCDSIFPSVFDACLHHVINTLNVRIPHQNRASVRQQGTLEWSIMGSLDCDMIEIRLDPSFVCFDVESFLPTPAKIKFSTAGSVENSIRNALLALFVAQLGH